ncbi:MAG: hypothetical protein PHW04_14805 [Candidatus Wallbacteria bacterium]|nr:hypothetical protein [Candidatus Wallbacteria bacterium]
MAWIAVFESISIYWIDRWGDPLDKAKQVLNPDSRLGWRQKADYNGRFLKIALKTNELGMRNIPLAKIDKNAKTILVLGPSSTFGWGVEEQQAYPALLEDLLVRKYKDQVISVINAGQIGFSSWQGLQFFKNDLSGKLKSNILIIAYGVNDVDRFRFFDTSPLPDKEEFATPKKTWKIRLLNLLYRFNFGNLLSRRIFNLFEDFSSRPIGIPVRRVDDTDFEKNIREMIQFAKSSGSEIILLTSAYKLPSFGSVEQKINEQYQELFETGVKKYEEKQYLVALTYFKKATEVKPDRNLTYYYLSSCYSYLGNSGEKKKMFEMARRTEPKRIAEDVDKLNQVLMKIAVQEGVLLVDSMKSLSLLSPDSGFIDPIHMSALGNEAVAENLAVEIYGHDLLKINQRRESNEPGN